MPEYINFLAIVLVYFFVVYLTAIRRGGQSVLPWLFLILLQSASLYYREFVCEYVKKLPFLIQQPQTVCQGVSIGILVVINILAIVLINLITTSRKKKPEPQEFTLSSEDIPPITSMEQETAFQQESQQMGWKPDPAMGKDEKPSADFNVNDETIFETISSLIDNGNQEAAIKYLRMVIFFGKNESFISQAKEMLNTLQKGVKTNAKDANS